MRAIELNGAAVEMNKPAFDVGPARRARPGARSQRAASRPGEPSLSAGARRSTT